MHSTSRRRLLQAGVTSAAGLAIATRFPISPAFAAPAGPEDFATIRSRWRTATIGGTFDGTDPAYSAALKSLTTTVDTLVKNLDRSAGRTQVFTDLPLGSASANITATFKGLKNLAIAYLTPGTSYTGDASLRDAAIDGLDFMVAGPYSHKTPDLGMMHGYGNWWDWQIGAPQNFEDAALLLYDDLSAAQRSSYTSAIDYFVEDPTITPMQYSKPVSTGANRIDLCRVVIVRGALDDNAAKVAQGSDAIAPTLPFATSGDGLYTDGSWIQHTNVAYTGTYGAVWLSGLTQLITALAGTGWAPKSPDLDNVFFAAVHGFRPVVYNGLMLDSVRGRAIARATETDLDDGVAVIKTFLLLAPTADAKTASLLRSTAKGWLKRAPLDLKKLTTPLTIRLAQDVLADDSVQAAPEPAGHTLFPVMNRAIHRRDGWAVAISMDSDRVSYYETGGGENLHGWHTGQGMTYTYLDSDNLHYTDGFWPTVDPYRLPGTTTSRLPLTDGQGGDYATPAPTSRWAGGTTDGEFAALGQDLEGPFGTLRAKKSWFCLDDAVVCLGAGITSSDGAEVDTVIDNRKVSDRNARLLVSGSPERGAVVSRRARWAHLAGQSGYVFPKGARITAVREQRTGAWRDISTGGPTDRLQRDYVTLYLDHGDDPDAADYCYILMPNAAAGRVAKRAEDRDWLKVLANTADQQAIAVPSLGVTAANFFAGGTVGALTSNGPASVLIRQSRRGRVHLTLADPTRTATGLTIEWRARVRSVISKPGSVRTRLTAKSIVIDAGDLTTAAGETRELVLELR